MKFRKITVGCTSDVSEYIAYILHDCGSIGEVFSDYNDVKRVLEEKRWDYADASLFEKTDTCTVSGFFHIETQINCVMERIEQLKNESWADFSGINTCEEIIDSEEWENEWKKYYKPFSIGSIVIVPQWIAYNAAAGEKTVLLDPGLAFGTGTHETTSMCIDLMQRIDIRDKTVLDFGCGSGILGICAHKLGAKAVIFADTDEQAVCATKNNCALNGILHPNVLNCDVRDMKEPADVVIANITADVLTDVEPVIRAALKKGGYAIISGIISDRTRSIESVYCRHFSPVDSERKNEWSAYIYKL